jgi:RNA polymerase sigma factor (sigma-70 family)
MARTNDPQEPRPPRLRLLEPPLATRPLPAAVPLLRPDQPVTPAQDALLTGFARRAREGDRDARELLWRAFAPRLEPALRRCGRMTWQTNWPRRGDLPWELDDLRQEAWLVFADLADGWNGEGSFVPYVTAYFPWRLRNAMRRLAPTRRAAPLYLAARIAVDCEGLLDAETAEVLAALAASLSPGDAAVLQMRVGEGAGFAEIACRLGLSRRTVIRRWRRIQRVVRSLLDEPAQPTPRSPSPGSP